MGVVIRVPTPPLMMSNIGMDEMPGKKHEKLRPWPKNPENCNNVHTDHERLHSCINMFDCVVYRHLLVQNFVIL